MFGFGKPNIKKMEEKKNVRGLIKALRDETDQQVRKNAAKALGNIGNAYAVEPLIKALKDFDKDVSCEAQWALGKIGMPAVESLIKLLNESVNLDKNIREKIVQILGEIGNAQAVEPIVKALSNSKDYSTRWMAAEALGKIGDTRAVEPLIKALSDLNSNDLIFRLKTTEALGKIGDARAVEQLIKILGDSYCRDGATEALVKIGAPATEHLVKALSDSNSEICGAAAEILEKIEWKSNADETIAQYWIAKRRWYECVKIGAPAVKPLIKALSNSEWIVTNKAAVSLDAIGWKPSNDKIAAQYWIAKKEWDKCVEIGAPAIEPLIKALNDNDKRVSYWKQQEINTHLSYSERYPDFDGSFLVTVLGKIGDVRAVEPLIKVLKNSRCGTTRKAAAISLLHLYKHEKIDQNAKNSILNVKTLITNPHYDGMKSTGASSDCRDSHEDIGVGLNFHI